MDNRIFAGLSRRLLALVLAAAMVLPNPAGAYALDGELVTGPAEIATETQAAETVPAEQTAPAEETVGETAPMEETVPAAETVSQEETAPAEETVPGETAAETDGEALQVSDEQTGQETLGAAAPIDGRKDNTVYFDLGLGDVFITVETYSGKVYVQNPDGALTETEVSGVYSEDLTYYVFQSNPAENMPKGYVVLDGDSRVSDVQYPEYARVENWGTTITNNQNVAEVVSGWKTLAEAGNRAPTAYRVDVTGGGVYDLVIDDVWSSYIEKNTSRTTGSISFLPGTAESGDLMLTYAGDNRLENILYTSSANYNSRNGSGNRLLLRGERETDTLTVAATAAGGNAWNSAIGATDTKGERASTIEITGGVLYAGAHAGDNCTAIGGGGNGYADIIISGGTVTAVTASNGAAIGGGVGGSRYGGDTTILISGGNVYAYNLGPGAAIGGGSANNDHGGHSDITITGGAVTAAGGQTAIGGGAGTTAGRTDVEITPDARVTGDVNAKKVVYQDGEVLLGTFYSSGTETPEIQEPVKLEYYFIGWKDANGADWTAELTEDVTYIAQWVESPFLEAVYFDLALGDVTLTETEYRGVIYSQIHGRAVTLTGEHQPDTQYYIYQSGENNVTQTGIQDTGVVALPEGVPVADWAGYITNNEDVTDVVTQWEARKGTRSPTSNHIHVVGDSTFRITIQDLWSQYCERNDYRTTGSIGFLAEGSGQMALTFVGDNRLESLHYRGSDSSQSLTIRGGTKADTLTVAATEDGGNHWCSAIGADDGCFATHNIRITQGTVFAGTRRQDNCTAIGGGGNGYSSVYIADGAVVTAVSSSSGTAIGGGIGYHSPGGDAYVHISGGEVYAYNHGILLKDTQQSSPYYGQYFAVPAVAIGGGSSIEADGNANTTVEITGGTVVARSVHGAAIGGGGSATKNGGSATVNISGGRVTAASVAGTVYGILDGADDYRDTSRDVPAGVSIGGGTGCLSGGSAVLNISGNATVIDTGSIGGGSATEKGKPLGYAKVTVSGGTIQGQVIMQTTGTEENCSFEMTGGLINNIRHKEAKAKTFVSNGQTFTFLEDNGGAVCMYDEKGTTRILGGEIKNGYAQNGGAVYMLGGSFTMSGGAIQDCVATASGGAVYLGGGAVSISDGAVTGNTAGQNGGGIAVEDGSIVMSGGAVEANTASSGDGGGMFVSGSDEVAVKVYSGSVSGNRAQGSGGAVAVQGGDTSSIEVQIGVNKKHEFADGVMKAFEHTETEGTYTHQVCPVIKNNRSTASGGAFYISGGTQTELNIFCLVEEGNQTQQDKDINNVVLSSFLMVEGGKVLISSSAESTGDQVEEEPDNCGSAVVTGTIHVVGGTLDLYGNMDNPSFEDRITVDLTKEGDHYADHRGSKTHIKLNYHENFNINGRIDSTHTAIDLDNGEVHIISNNLYVHPGYELVGWNVNPNPTDNEEGWYTPGDSITFYNNGTHTGEGNYVGGELTLYAIWEANGYYVEFLPNVPEGEMYAGTMEKQAFTYGVEDTLNANAFRRPGYVFQGWSYTDDAGEPRTLEDGAAVLNLTSVRGGTVTLTARWELCDHDDHNVTYSAWQETEQKAGLKKSCTCGYEATVTLTAADAVYDKEKHEAKTEASDPDWTVTEIRYSGQKPGSEEAVAADRLCINAGSYTATIQAPDQSVSASVTYTIEKAEQPAPDQVPAYQEPPADSNVLTVEPITNHTSVHTGETTAEYAVRYYQDGEEIVTDWVPGTDGQNSEIHLPAGLTYYTVLVRYGENDNYLASGEKAADSTFFFQGSIHLTIKATEGITYELVGSEKEYYLVTGLKEGYYLSSDGFTIEKTGDKPDYLTLDEDSDDEPAKGKFLLKAAVPDGETADITLSIGTSRKIPVISSAVEEKQVFGAVAGNTATISRDSAWTVYYGVSDYDTEAYQQPSLHFSPAIPGGTTIILLDKSSGGYWSYAASAETGSVPLSGFNRMGAAHTDGNKYRAESGDLKLQFVVDFSGVNGGMSGTKVTATLRIDKLPGEENKAPELLEMTQTNKPTVEVALADTAFSLQDNGGGGLDWKLSSSFTPNAAASRWDNRDLALLLTPETGTVLPPDAKLSALVGSDRIDCRLNKAGCFLIPLGGFRKDIVLTLQSDMFPENGARYPMTAQLIVSRSVAEMAPLNGTRVADPVSVIFANTEQNLSVKVYTGDDRRLFSSEESIAVTVDTGATDVPAGYKLKVRLEQKHQDGTYVDTGYKAASGAGVYTFNLAGCVADSYRVLVTIERDNGYAVLQAPYYFIIQ